MRVVVADDSMLIREGLARLLADAGVDVVGTAGNRPSSSAGRAHAPDVAIVDIKMPPRTPTRASRRRWRYAGTHPHVGVLVLSQYLESRYARLLEERRSGSATCSRTGLGHRRPRGRAEEINEGECVIDPTIISRLVNRPRERARSTS